MVLNYGMITIFAMLNKNFKTMRKIYKLTVAVALLLLGAFSLKAQETDVYVGGIKNNFAAIWKNGVAQTTNDWEIRSLAFVGDDIYVGGLNETGIPVIKKNDEVLYTLEFDQQCMGSSLSSMTVHGDDVYATTIYLTSAGGFYGKLWINGVASQDYADATELYAVCVDGDDVYVAGGTNEAAVIWKNAEPYYVYPTTATGLFVDIEIVDGDIYYVGGDFGGSGKGNCTAGAVLSKNDIDLNQDYNRFGISVWKNGEIIYNLGSPVYNAKICVSDGVVYASGQVPSGSVYKAILWVNGQGTYLADQWSSVGDITVCNGDLYATGFVGSYPELDVFVWNNGEANVLTSPGYDSGNCIVVISTVDVEEEVENMYSIYPNPVTDYLSIDGISFDEAIIYNNLGQIVLKSNNNRIDVSSLESGIYLLKLDNSISRRIVINH